MEFCSDDCFNNYYFSLEKKPSKVYDIDSTDYNSDFNNNTNRCQIKVNGKSYDSYDDYLKDRNREVSNKETGITRYTNTDGSIVTRYNTKSVGNNAVHDNYLVQKERKKKALKALHGCSYVTKPNGIDLILCTEWCSICGNCDVECDCNSKIDNEIELYKKSNTSLTKYLDDDIEDEKVMDFIDNSYICKFCSEVNYDKICSICGAINNDYTYQEPDYRNSLSDEEQDRSNIEELYSNYDNTDIISTKDNHNTCKCVEVTNTASTNLRCKCGWLYEPEQITTCALCEALFITGRGYSFHTGVEEYEVCSQQCMYYNGEDYAYMSGLCNL
jgi:hypothetical protein